MSLTVAKAALPSSLTNDSAMLAIGAPIPPPLSPTKVPPLRPDAYPQRNKANSTATAVQTPVAVVMREPLATPPQTLELRSHDTRRLHRPMQLNGPWTRFTSFPDEALLRLQYA